MRPGQLVVHQEEAWSVAARAPEQDIAAAARPLLAAELCVHDGSVGDGHVLVDAMGSYDLDLDVHVQPRGLAASSIDRCTTGSLPSAWAIVRCCAPPVQAYPDSTGDNSLDNSMNFSCSSCHRGISMVVPACRT